MFNAQNSSISASPWFPSRTIDLEENFLISSVIVHRGDMEISTPPLFSILLSEDGSNWVCVYSQTSHICDGKDDFFIKFNQKLIARFVRLRLDGARNAWNPSFNVNTERSFSEVDISVSSFLSESQKIADNSRVVISTLFNESDDFLKMYVDNFLAFTPENVSLVVNLPPGRKIPEKIFTYTPRISIFNGSLPRQKWGESLVIGHLESLEFSINNIGNFDFFCTLASNSLFYRPLDLNAVIVQLDLNGIAPVGGERIYDHDVDIDTFSPPENGTWMWHHYRQISGLDIYIENNFGLDRLSVTQIEGLFAAKEDWMKVLFYKNQILGLSDYCNNSFIMALEEVLPLSIFRKYGSGRFVHICHMLWRPPRAVTIADLCDMGPHCPEHICVLKWFERDGRSPATVAVSTQWGRDLLGLQSSTYLGDSVNRLLTICNFKKALSSQINSDPLTKGWPHYSGSSGVVNLRWASSSYLVNRQRFDVKIQSPSQENSMSPAHLFFENTENIIDLSLFIYEDNEGHSILNYSCFSSSQDSFMGSDTVLQAYLYLSPMRSGSHFKIIINSENFNTILGHSGFVFFDGVNYFQKKIDLELNNENEKELYFLVDRDNIHIGIPIYSSQCVQMKMVIIHD